MGPGLQTYTDKEPTRSEMGRMTEDLDQGMTTTSLPPLRGKFISWAKESITSVGARGGNG